MEAPDFLWEAYDTRTGRSVGIAVYNTEEQVLAAIEGWRARDRRGGRPDIHDLMPFLGARPFKMGERLGFHHGHREWCCSNNGGLCCCPSGVLYEEVVDD